MNPFTHDFWHRWATARIACRPPRRRESRAGIAAVLSLTVGPMRGWR